MKITIYHYPKCSTSNAALSFLRSQNIDPEIVLYCESGLKSEEILNLMTILNLSHPRDIVKRNGITYRNLGLAHKNLSNQEWIDVIIENPKLLQRPIVVCKSNAVIAKNNEIIADFLKLV